MVYFNSMELNLSSKKVTGAISLFSNGFLTALKVLTGILTGSISLLSEGMHSFGDCLASLIAFYSVVESEKPADFEHQFGHGKFEDLAGFIEACLVIVSAFFIIFVAFKNIITKGHNHEFSADIALYAIIFSIIINFIVGIYVTRIGEKTDSSALIGDGFHILSDVYSSLGVFFGILAVKYTGFYILDPLIAIITGSMILKTGFSLFVKSTSNLLDVSLPEENLEVIQSVLEEYKKEGLLGVKRIKTSKSGSTKNIVLVIYLCPDTTLAKTHTLCDKIETRLEKELNHTNVIIHSEPYGS